MMARTSCPWPRLNTAEADDVWRRFEERFRFRPSVHAEAWPSIDEPVPSITFEIEDDLTSEREEAIRDWALGAMRACTKRDERVYFLDWQHECYWVSPHRTTSEPSRSALPVVPSGDYAIYLARDLSWGLFGHPWEGSLCAFGERFVRKLEAPPPHALTVLRTDGRS